MNIIYGHLTLDLFQGQVPVFDFLKISDPAYDPHIRVLKDAIRVTVLLRVKLSVVGWGNAYIIFKVPLKAPYVLVSALQSHLQNGKLGLLQHGFSVIRSDASKKRVIVVPQCFMYTVGKVVGAVSDGFCDLVKWKRFLIVLIDVID